MIKTIKHPYGNKKISIIKFFKGAAEKRMQWIHGVFSNCEASVQMLRYIGFGCTLRAH